MVVRGSKMAKDKGIIEIGNLAVASSSNYAANHALMPQAADAATNSVISQAMTVSGFRWNINFSPTAVTTAQRYKWVVWVRRKKAPISSIPMVSNGTPTDGFNQIDENNIIVWGIGMSMNGQPYCSDGATKTQRKMQAGDQLVFSIVAQTAGATDGLQYSALFQTFWKS